MTLRDWIREQLRPAAGHDVLGDVILEESEKILAATNELDAQIPDGAEAVLRRRYEDGLERIRSLLKEVRAGACGKEAPPEHVARSVLRGRWRARIAKEHTS